MRGFDAKRGPYVVERVPHAVYYNGNYALHGAYWHHDFGHPKSHGCTNVPPRAMRWLVNYLDLTAPPGWQGRSLQDGTQRLSLWLYFTRDTPTKLAAVQTHRGFPDGQSST